MMREYPPIRIRPLTLRGVFGITWKVFRRRLGAVAGYQFLYCLFTLVVCAPSIMAFVNAALSSEGLDLETGASVFAFGGSLVLGLLLLGVAFLALTLLAQPVYTGTLYGEMSARIYGSASPVGLMLKRSKHSLKRFFTTVLCYMLCSMLLSMAVNLLTGIFSSFATVFSLIGMVPGIIDGDPFSIGAGAIVPFALITLIIMAIQTAAMSFLSFVFPVAVNEPAKNFAAVKRSFRLVGKRFFRVFGCTLLLSGVVLLTAAVYALLIVLGSFVADTAVSLVLMGVGMLIYLLLIFFLAPYQAALTTVLYFDSRTRAEGTAWLGEPEEAPAQPQYAPPAGAEPVEPEYVDSEYAEPAGPAPDELPLRELPPREPPDDNGLS